MDFAKSSSSSAGLQKRTGFGTRETRPSNLRLSWILQVGRLSFLQLLFDATVVDRYPEKDPAQYTEYERKYPPDKYVPRYPFELHNLMPISRYGDEAKPNARVWKVYQDRANELDADRIEGWNKTLDILLIFVRSPIAGRLGGTC
jgi:hypothetical protein